MKETESDHHIINTTLFQPPPIVGSYRIGGSQTNYYQFNFSSKPKWFHRKMMKLCFGFEWMDVKSLEFKKNYYF